MNNKDLTIVIDGTVGSGKSTLMNVLEEKGFDPFPEPVFSNPLLDKFYHDKTRYAFSLQVFFLNKRFEHMKSVGSGWNVLDRSIFGDEIFARMLHDSGHISPEEINIYLELLNNMLEHVKTPDLMIYLKSSTETAVNRIQKRGREYEQHVDRTYWEDLNNRYKEFFREFKSCPVLEIDVTNLDFEHNEQDQDYVMNKINDKLKDLNYNPLRAAN